MEELLTARGLAYFYMDDGYKVSSGFNFCTECYTLDEQKFLASVLRNKFSLECGVHSHSNGHRLYVHSSSKDKFVELVKPYILPMFNYKLRL